MLAAESIAVAKRKAKASRKKVQPPRPEILLQVIEHTANEADPGIRELWANLLANEMIGEAVHPEIGRVLNRLSSDDAQLLASIKGKRSNSISEAFAATIKVIVVQLPIAPSGPLTDNSLTMRT